MRKVLIGLMILGLVGTGYCSIREVWIDDLKQSTAVTLIVGPFEDDAGDGVIVTVTPANVGMTIIKADGTLIEDDALDAGNVLTVINTAVLPADGMATLTILASQVDVLGAWSCTLFDTDVMEPLVLRGRVVTSKAYNLRVSGTVDVDTIRATAPLSNATGINVATANGVALPTVAGMSSGVWQTTAAGNFTVAGSIGQNLKTTGNTPGSASGLAIVGSDMGISATEATQIATAVTADTWGALWTSYTTENSFGCIVKRMFDKVMGLRK